MEKELIIYLLKINILLIHFSVGYITLLHIEKKTPVEVEKSTRYWIVILGFIISILYLIWGMKILEDRGGKNQSTSHE